MFIHRQRQVIIAALKMFSVVRELNFLIQVYFTNRK